MEQNKVSFQNPLTGEPLCQQEIDEMFMRRCLQLAKNLSLIHISEPTRQYS